MSCLACTSHRHGGCVSPESKRRFDDPSLEPCFLFSQVVQAPAIKAPEPPRAEYERPISEWGPMMNAQAHVEPWQQPRRPAHLPRNTPPKRTYLEQSAGYDD